MTRNLVFILGVCMGLALSAADAFAGPRPGSQLQNDWQAAGVPTRPQLGDGGGLGMYVTDGGTGCAAVTGGQPYAFWCDVAVNVCFAGSAAMGEGDGGACLSTATDIAYGWPLGAAAKGGPVVTTPTTWAVCAHPTSGATANCPVFQMH